jgi:hypothetical protein
MPEGGARMTDPDLKPCPFCGEPGSFFSPVRDERGEEVPGAWVVSCPECQIDFSCDDSTMEEIAELWNRRSDGDLA